MQRATVFRGWRGGGVWIGEGRVLDISLRYVPLVHSPILVLKPKTLVNPIPFANPNSNRKFISLARLSAIKEW